MINKKELGIGSKVNYIGMPDDKPVTVDIVEVYKYSVLFEYEGNYGSTPYSNLLEIPLTAEWLERCGWQLVDQGRGPYYWLEKQCWFHIHLSEDGTLYANFNNNAITIKYLHQLQNIYLDLTGEEIAINETI